MDQSDNLSTKNLNEGSQLKKLLENGTQANRKSFSNDGKLGNNEETKNDQNLKSNIDLEKDNGTYICNKKRKVSGYLNRGYKCPKMEKVNDLSNNSYDLGLSSKSDNLSPNVTHNSTAAASQSALKPKGSNYQAETRSAEDDPPIKQFPLKYGEDILPQDCSNISDRSRHQNVFSFNLWLDWAKERNIKVS